MVNSTRRLLRAARAGAFSTMLLAGTLLAGGAVASTDPQVPSRGARANASISETDGQTYTNPLMGFSITAPPEWTVGETGRRIPVVQIDPPGRTDLVSIHVSIHRHIGSKDVREWTDSQVSQYGKQFIDILEEYPRVVGEVTRGYQMVFEWNSDLGIKEQWTGVIRGAQGYIIRTFGTATDYDRLRDTIDAAVSTFTLLDPDPEQASSDDVFVLLGREPDTLDPALHFGAATGPLRAVFGGLVRLDEDMNVVPDIAESWRVSESGTVYTFTIRLNAFAHSGDWITAKDIEYSWERATDVSTGSPTAGAYLGDIVGVREKLDGVAEEISGVEVIGLHTLRVILRSPRPTFLHKLTHPVASVVDRANVEAGEIGERPVGTGPFEFVRWDDGQGIVLERNRIYHLPKPTLRGVVYRFDAGDPFSLYAAKQIDVMPVPMTHVDRARDPRSKMNHDLVTRPSFCTHYLAFDVEVPPFDSVAARRAFAQAMDVDKIVSSTMRGAVERASTLVPPGIAGHNRSLPRVPFAPDTARWWLEKFAEPVDDLPYVASAVDIPTMVWMWRENLGLNVRAVEGPSSEYAGVWTETFCPDYLDPENYLEFLLHSDGLYNRSGYSNSKIDALLEDASRLIDPDERSAAYARIESLARGDWVVVPLWHERREELVQQYVVGYRPPSTGAPSFHDIYFEW